MPTIQGIINTVLFFFFNKSHNQEIEKTKIKAVEETDNGRWGATDT